MTTTVQLITRETRMNGYSYETQVVEFPKIVAYGDTRIGTEIAALRAVRDVMERADAHKGIIDRDCTPDPTVTTRVATVPEAAGGSTA